MALSSGDTIGPYQILAPIGEGGMGEVFRARDTRLDRTVAIKVSKAAFGERFMREAKSVAALNHPNICTLFDVGPDYLVMEFIEGAPLKGPLPVEKAVEYASQILDALDAAHRKGFVHHDLKPANVMVTRQGIKLLDFGLARQTAPIAATDATRTAVMGDGEIAGTPQYMSPEQLQGKPSDARSDLFAFGCVLHELLSGKKAFDGETTASVVAAILEREPAPLDLHPPLGRVIRKCLAKDPDERFQNARDLKTALAWAMEQQPATGSSKAVRWPWAVATALVIGVLIGGAVMRSRQASAPEQAHRFQLNPPEGGEFQLNSGFAISPDGKSLAFVASVPGKSGLWVRQMDGTASRLLPGTEGAVFPFWSPDGRSVAYQASGKFWRVDVAGGAPISICDANVSRGGYWGPDGVIVFSLGSRGLNRVAASGGAVENLTTPDTGRGELAHRFPQLLPSGRTLFEVTGKPEVAGIYATSLGNPREQVRLVATNGNGVYAAGHLLWLRGGTLVAQRFNPDRLQLSGEPRPVADPVGITFGAMVAAASSSGLLVHGRLGGTQLTWLDHAGKADGSNGGTLGEPGDYGWLRISPDGRWVVVDRLSGGGRALWMLDVERAALSRFTFLPGTSLIPVWSPDGRQVMFRSGSPPNLYRKEASGAGTEQRVTDSVNYQDPLDWSRDGRLVLYYESAPDTHGDLWVLPVTPDGRPDPNARARPYLRTRFNEIDGQFSPQPNPRWVAYTSDESGRYEVYVQAFPEPRGKFQVSTGGGRDPQWSPDGRELYYVSPDRKLMAAGLKVGADSVAASTPRELFAIPPGLSSQPYAVAPDGKRFLVRMPVGGSQPLEVVVNWPALLKQGAPNE